MVGFCMRAQLQGMSPSSSSFSSSSVALITQICPLLVLLRLRQWHQQNTIFYLESPPKKRDRLFSLKFQFFKLFWRQSTNMTMFCAFLQFVKKIIPLMAPFWPMRWGFFLNRPEKIIRYLILKIVAFIWHFIYFLFFPSTL